MSTEVKKVFLGSAALSLPTHYEKLKDSCLRLGMLPQSTEYLPPAQTNKLIAALELVENSDIYLGVFAFQYGEVFDNPQHNPGRHSIAELEYRKALERKIPLIVFFMDENHQITVHDIDPTPRFAKLEKLKSFITENHTPKKFISAEDLGAKVLQALSQHRNTSNKPTVHPPSDTAPFSQTFIAHHYSLLQTAQVVGRQDELNHLTDWVLNFKTQPVDSVSLSTARVLNIVAIGGMGKSALAWRWFNDIVPEAAKQFKGRIWWSFYESNATWENFVVRTLAYVNNKTPEEIEKLSELDRENRLLEALNQTPFLIVMDGFERLLIQFANANAAYGADDEYDIETANYVAGAYGLSEDNVQTYIGQHRLRKCADPRVGKFLVRLTRLALTASRVLITTRLYPTELQTEAGSSIPGSAAIFLHGMSDEDALRLWRAFGVDGSPHELLPMFHRFENYPLLIRALAGAVARPGHGSGDFDAWRHAHSDFDPTQTLPLIKEKTHVLQFALTGLDPKVRKTLETIAGFRMPVNYDILEAILVNVSHPEDIIYGSTKQEKLFSKVSDLIAALIELGDRGLVGWDQNPKANRYDVHPIVRGTAWGGLGENDKHEMYERLSQYFNSMAMIEYDAVKRYEDLTPAIELYYALIGAKHYEEAFWVFRTRIENATLYRLNAARQRAKLLELMFPDGMAERPRLQDNHSQSNTLNMLALSYKNSGQPGRALLFYERAVAIDKTAKYNIGLAVKLRNLSSAQRLAGQLYLAEYNARRSLSASHEEIAPFHEGLSFYTIGLSVASRANDQQVDNLVDSTLQRSLAIRTEWKDKQGEGVIYAFLAQVALWQDKFPEAKENADRAWRLADVNQKCDYVRAQRVQGMAELGLNNLEQAEKLLSQALKQAREVNLTQEELPALVGLADLARQRGDLAAARVHLDDVWELAERGPYPLFHADALNVLAQIERDAGNRAAAIQAATAAYQKAWCDGEPYAYAYGLRQARAYLAALGAPEPKLPPFDASAFPPMPEVEIP
jgi:tetratricopeptide (TPR) repeat protein